MRSGPRNPFLADSGNAMAHGRCDQQDNTPGRGPEGPTEVLGAADIQYAPLGPGHFGGLISGLYPDGRRVIWSNGRQTIAKLDYDNLEVLATLPTGTEPVTGQAELEALEAGLDDLDGSGTTPSLMGFGEDEDRFVVIGDGDEVVNITLLWRDDIPDDWEQLTGAPSRRIAGIGPAHMGDPSRPEIKTEQSITVSGYGAMTVNNEPASLPDGWPTTRARLFSFFLGHKPAYTPYGLHKYEWDPAERRLKEAWVNTGVSSPNSVPFVAQGSDLVYTCGTRGGKWTIEALDWTTGASRFHYVVGGSRYNTLGGGVTVDDDGRLLYGTVFGKVRILR